MTLVLRLAAALVGLALIRAAIGSAVRTFVLPRSAGDPVTYGTFQVLRRVFDLRVGRARTFLERDEIMAMFAPFGLLFLLVVWLAMILLGYALLFRAAGVPDWRDALAMSGSSLFTLGFMPGESMVQVLLIFSEATIGLIMVALLIAYLPTMYGAFSSREREVTLLEVRAGTPPSAVEMIRRFHRLGRKDDEFAALWRDWERWFAEVEESHTSLAALVFFRSPQPDHSWVTAAGAVLDAAALMNAVVDLRKGPESSLCLRAGYLALRHIADFFRVPYNPDPRFPADPISITRDEFDAVCSALAADGVPLHSDRDQAWQDFGGWRVNYDTPLLALCRLTMAPEAPWSSDRA